MNFKPFILAGFAAALLGVIASCEVGPNYSRPALDVPTTYKSASTQSATAPATAPAPLTDHWWLLFNDPDLTTLEDAAIHNNPDIAAAMARVEQARAITQDVRSAFFPLITANPSATRSRTSANHTRGGSSTTANDILLPFDLSYEVDIWGRIRRSYEASNAQLHASRDDFYVVLQTLESDVAQNYWNLRVLEAQDIIYSENIALYDQQIALDQTKLAAGIIGKIDIVQIQTLRASTITLQLDTRRQRDDAGHALAVLLGKPPAEFQIAINPNLPDPPSIPPNLPADILRQRPDVAEAEQNLVAANAQIGVATANFYPVVRLTGTAGYESFDVQHVVDWESRLWSLGPSVSIPLFEGGKLTADLQQAKARYDELVANYRSIVLTAFSDVEISLTDIHFRNRSVEAQQQAVDSAREYLRLAELERAQGIFSTLQVVDADRSLLVNELALVQLRSDRLISTVLLMKALGGGWKDTDTIALPEPAPK